MRRPQCVGRCSRSIATIVWILRTFSSLVSVWRSIINNGWSVITIQLSLDSITSAQEIRNLSAGALRATKTWARHLILTKHVIIYYLQFFQLNQFWIFRPWTPAALELGILIVNAFFTTFKVMFSDTFPFNIAGLGKIKCSHFITHLNFLWIYLLLDISKDFVATFVNKSCFM